MGTMGKTIPGNAFRSLVLTSHEVTLSLADAPEFVGAGDVVTSPRAVVRIAGAVIGSRATESVLVLMLDSRHKVTGYAEVARGAVNAARIDSAGAVFRPALIAGAAAVVVAHNHPSGDPSPSRGDRVVTSALVTAGRTLGVAVLDHVIVTAGGEFYSFADAGAIADDDRLAVADGDAPEYARGEERDVIDAAGSYRGFVRRTLGGFYRGWRIAGIGLGPFASEASARAWVLGEREGTDAGMIGDGDAPAYEPAPQSDRWRAAVRTAVARVYWTSKAAERARMTAAYRLVAADLNSLHVEGDSYLACVATDLRDIADMIGLVETSRLGDGDAPAYAPRTAADLAECEERLADLETSRAAMVATLGDVRLRDLADGETIGTRPGGFSPAHVLGGLDPDSESDLRAAAERVRELRAQHSAIVAEIRAGKDERREIVAEIARATGRAPVGWFKVAGTHAFEPVQTFRTAIAEPAPAFEPVAPIVRPVATVAAVVEYSPEWPPIAAYADIDAAPVCAPVATVAAVAVFRPVPMPMERVAADSAPAFELAARRPGGRRLWRALVTVARAYWATVARSVDWIESDRAAEPSGATFRHAGAVAYALADGDAPAYGAGSISDSERERWHGLARIAADQKRAEESRVAGILAAVDGLAALDPTCWYDTATQFTCTEADALADLFRAMGEPEFADRFIAEHARGDEEGDSPEHIAALFAAGRGEMVDGDAPAYVACVRCGRSKADGVTVIRFVPVFGLPGASTPPVCADTRECARFVAEPVSTGEASIAHGNSWAESAVDETAAPAPREYNGPTYERFKGSKCTGYRSVTEVAKDVRKDIAAAVDAGELPPLVYSVTVEHYSMGQSMNITVRGVPDRLHRDEGARALLAQLDSIMAAYNWDGSDIQTDYFDVMFYGHASFEYEGARQDRERLAEKRKTTKATPRPDRRTLVAHVRGHHRFGSTDRASFDTLSLWHRLGHDPKPGKAAFYSEPYHRDHSIEDLSSTSSVPTAPAAPVLRVMEEAPAYRAPRVELGETELRRRCADCREWTHRDELNDSGQCGYCSREADAEAVDQIAALLTGRQWTPEDFDRVAEIVRGVGRVIAEPAAPCCSRCGDPFEPDETPVDGEHAACYRMSDGDTPAYTVTRRRTVAPGWDVATTTGDKIGYVVRRYRTWDVGAWHEGALLQWETAGTKAQAVAEVLRSYAPWTLESAYVKLAEAEARLDVTRRRLPRVDEAARACVEARDIAYREHCDTLASCARLQADIIAELRRLNDEAEAALEDEVDNPSHGLGDGDAPAYASVPADCSEALEIALAADAAELYAVVVARRLAAERARGAAAQAEREYSDAVDAYRQVADGDAPEYRVDGPPMGRMSYSDLLWLFGPITGGLKLSPEAADWLNSAPTEDRFEARAAGLVICRADVAEAAACGLQDGDGLEYLGSYGCAAYTCAVRGALGDGAARTAHVRHIDSVRELIANVKTWGEPNSESTSIGLHCIGMDLESLRAGIVASGPLPQLDDGDAPGYSDPPMPDCADCGHPYLTHGHFGECGGRIPALWPKGSTRPCPCREWRFATAPTGFGAPVDDIGDPLDVAELRDRVRRIIEALRLGETFDQYRQAVDEGNEDVANRIGADIADAFTKAAAWEDDSPTQ